MSKQNRRNLGVLDYSVLHKTGEKIVKEMALNEEILLEAKIAEDVREFFIVNNLNELSNEDEVNEAIKNAGLQSKKFRDVHTELRLGLKSEYDKQYPKYAEQVKRLREYVVEARKMLRGMKEKEEAVQMKVEEEVKMAEKNERKKALESEYDFFLAKLDRKMNRYDWGLSSDYNEITANINSLEGPVDEWYVLHGKLKGLFGEEYAIKFENKFSEILERVNHKIEEGKLRLKEILQLHEESTRKLEDEKTRIEREKEAMEQNLVKLEQEKLYNEKQICAKNLYEVIKLLSRSLCSGCRIDLKNVGDHQLLELKKNVFQFTFKLRDILEKITEFSKLVVYLDTTEKMWMEELIELHTQTAGDVTRF